MRPQPGLERVAQGLLIDCERFQPDWPQAEIRFSDGKWRPATILAWCRYRQAWVAFVRWADGTEEWLIYNARYVQRAFDHLGGWAEE